MYFPIGDIHGNYDLIRRLYPKIIAAINGGIDPVNGGTIIFLGDYIDRGPDSDKVLDFLMGLKDDLTGEFPIKHVILRGNHEQFMIDFYHNPDDLVLLKIWLTNGGKETLDAFGVTVQELIDGALDNYIVWMEQLPIISYDDDYVFVHSGLNTYAPLNEQTENHCLWGTDTFPDAYTDFNKVVVHGHTWLSKNPRPFIDIKNNRVWMDVGAGLFGMLCTVGLPEPFDYGFENPDGYTIIKTDET